MGMISERETHIRALRGEIYRLARLRDQLDAVLDELHICRTAVRSTIRKLPPEVLVLIFELAMGENVADLVKIVNVCARWRTVALQAPCLWARIHVTGKQAVGQVAAANVNTWIKRAQKMPLSIRVAAPLYMAHRAHGKLSILQVAHLHPANRIRELSLHMFAGDLHVLAYQPPGVYTVLERLEVRLGGRADIDKAGYYPRRDSLYDLQDEPLASITAFENCPRLRSVALYGDRPINNNSPLAKHFPLPWAQLTNLVLQLPDCRSADSPPFLRCTSLVTGDIWVRRFNPDDHALGTTPVEFPNLRTLRLCLAGYPSALLQLIRAPGLRALAVEKEALDIQIWGALSQLCTHAPLLEDVKLINFDFCSPPTAKEEWLRQLPSVRSFTLERGTLQPSTMIPLFEAFPRTEILMPSLERLCFERVKPIVFDTCFGDTKRRELEWQDDIIFVQAIRSRLEAAEDDIVAQMRHLSLSYSSRLLTDSVRTDLEALTKKVPEFTVEISRTV